MKMLALFLAIVLLRGGGASVELRFAQPMTSDRSVTVVAPGGVRGTLRLFTLAGREAAREAFDTAPSGRFRVRLPQTGLASGVYFLCAEWPGGRVSRLLILLR